MQTKTCYRLFTNYEKEENWLNEMSAQGWQLERFNLFRYTFVQREPGEYTYRIELLNKDLSHDQSKAYLEFLKEMGIELVATHWRWVFLRKRKEEGPFVIYSDFDSKIHHEQRILNLYSLVLLINIMAMLMNIPTWVSSEILFPGIVVLLNLMASLSFGVLVIKQIKKLNKLKAKRQLTEQGE